MILIKLTGRRLFYQEVKIKTYPKEITTYKNQKYLTILRQECDNFGGSLWHGGSTKKMMRADGL